MGSFHYLSFIFTNSQTLLLYTNLPFSLNLFSSSQSLTAWSLSSLACCLSLILVSAFLSSPLPACSWLASKFTCYTFPYAILRLLYLEFHTHAHICTPNLKTDQFVCTLQLSCHHFQGASLNKMLLLHVYHNTLRIFTLLYFNDLFIYSTIMVWIFWA